MRRGERRFDPKVHKRKHVGRPGPAPSLDARFLAPIEDMDEAADIAAEVVNDLTRRLSSTVGDEAPPRLGRPPKSLSLSLFVGIISGLTRVSQRHVIPSTTEPGAIDHRTVTRTLASADGLTALQLILHRTHQMAASTGHPGAIKTDARRGPLLPQLVPHVGIGRARRKNDRGLLVDALLRSIAANIMIFARADEAAPEPEPVKPNAPSNDDEPASQHMLL